MSLILLMFNYLPNDLFDPFSDECFTANVIGKEDYIVDRDFDMAFNNRFKSVNSIVYYVKKHVSLSNGKKGQLELLSKILRKKFHHAYATYGMQDNWIAAVAGKFIWRDLSAKVIPDDILLDEVAACSQVSIVMMECCKELNIPTRKIALKGHYALECLIDGKWYFVDANLKPNFEAIGGRKSLAEILKKREQFALYANTILDSTNINYKFSEVQYGAVNQSPAPRAHLFHIVTKIVSHWLWLLPIIAFISFMRRK